MRGRDMTNGKLLIVDDELSVRDSLAKWFGEEGYEVATAESANQALTRVAEQVFDVALVDIKMRGIDGIELQRRLHEICPDMLVIIMTGYASVETAVVALKNGAYDYVNKPLDPEETAHLVANAMTHRKTQQENVRLKQTVAEITHPSEIVGQGAAMKRVFDAIETVAPTDATVLITGESGTGKELVARAIHAGSSRRFHPLVVIHCGALTESLLESELFGHEKGAFTGAQYRKKGKFEIAEGGTVFLDEIGDISLKTQTDLLRVLQEREIVRVGGNQIIKVDFRCVAATNKNLEQLIEEGKFRPDLFYRLNVFRIEMPLMRERQNAVERAMVVGQEPELKECDFNLKTGGVSNGLGKSLEDIERAHILRVLAECRGNQSRAAEILGIDRVTLHHKLKKYGWTRSPLGSR